MLCSLKVPASYEFKILNVIGVKPLNLRRESVLCQEQLTELDLDLVGRKVSADPSELCTGACRSALISLYLWSRLVDHMLQVPWRLGVR